MASLAERLVLLRTRIEDLPSSATAMTIRELENEARDLLAQSKNTAHEAEARELFTALARRSTPSGDEGGSGGNGEVRSLLRRARIRIDVAGDDQDIDEAIDILAEALDLDPDNRETHQLLAQAAQHSSQHALKVQDLVERYGFDFTVEDSSEAPAAPAAGLPAPSTDLSTTYQLGDLADTGSITPLPPENDPLAPVAQAYYAGDYQRTVELANRLLANDPGNAQATEYRQKAEENLMRGIVPDHRIPFEARVAYNRANSLVRAGNYDEAQGLYQEAREMAARAGIRSWNDVEQALLDIQDLALARELLNEGDRLLAADDWEGALRKYEGALRVVPNDPLAEDRIELINRVKNQFDQAAVQLSMMSGSMLERAEALNRLLGTLQALRQTLPGSDRLQQMVGEVRHRGENIKAQMLSQANNILGRAETASSLEEKAKLSQDARNLLAVTVGLDPTDPQATSKLERAEQIFGEVSEARQLLERAAAMIAQGTDSELSQARAILSNLRHYAADAAYRTLVADLLSAYIQRIELALDQGDVVNAERMITLTKEDPFRILGRRTEILRLQDEVRAMRRGVMLQRLLLAGGAIGLLLLLAFLTRGSWQAEFFPTETPMPTVTNTATTTQTPTATETLTMTPTETLTPTVTETPSHTPTASYTMTPSLTPTHTYTPSITPTPTETPSLTPTPEFLCEIFVTSPRNLRDRPDLNGQRAGQINQNVLARVLDSEVGSDGMVWYLISYRTGDATVQGWMQTGPHVIESTDCP